MQAISPKGLIFTVSALYMLTASGLDIFNPALTSIQSYFGASIGDMSFVLNAYFYGFSGLAVVMGVVGDRYDKKRIVLGGLLLFLVGSVLTVVADQLMLLVLGRFLQGIGAAGPVVLSLVVLLENYERSEHPRLIGTVSAVVAIATCLAPIAGGAITTLAGWRGSFVFLLAAGFIVTVLVLTYMPASPGDARVLLSAKSYLVLLQSANWLSDAFIISLLRANYLAFLGFSAIYYVKELRLPLVSLGFHQGSLALAFSLASIYSPKISKRLGEAWSVRASLWATAGVIGTTWLYLLLCDPNAVVITACMAIISMLVVFPNNILYPKVLAYLPEMRGRAAALVHAFKMLLSGFLIFMFARAYEHGFLWVAAILGGTYLACLTVFELRRNASVSKPARSPIL